MANGICVDYVWRIKDSNKLASLHLPCNIFNLPLSCCPGGKLLAPLWWTQWFWGGGSCVMHSKMYVDGWWGRGIEAWSETYNPAQLTKSHIDGYPIIGVLLFLAYLLYFITIVQVSRSHSPERPVRPHSPFGRSKALVSSAPSVENLLRSWEVASTCLWEANDTGFQCFILDMGPRAIDTNQIMSNLLSRLSTWVQFKILLLIGSSLAGHRRGNSTNTRGGGVLDYDRGNLRWIFV